MTCTIHKIIRRALGSRVQRSARGLQIAGKESAVHVKKRTALVHFEMITDVKKPSLNYIINTAMNFSRIVNKDYIDTQLLLPS